jgi:pilus assembly protein CpaB
MDVRKLVLLVGAMLVAGVAAFFARSMFAGGVETAVAAPVVAQKVEGPNVLVATKPLPIGTIVTAEHFTFQPWPSDMVEKAYFVKGEVEPTTLVGKVVRYTITAGQPVTQGSLVGPGERGFLAAALGAGMRAVTVSVSDLSSVAGFVLPGDRVDLVLTQEVGGEGGALKVSETVVRNLRVLAVDQTSDNTTNQPRVGRTITLEVTPKLAEKVIVAQTLGSLSLTLRAISDNAAELERAIASGEVEVGDDQSADADRAMELAVLTKPSDVNPTFTTGGEVSRFQRSTVPASPAGAGAGAPAARPSTPVVRVSRAGQVTEVPVGVN